MSSANGNEIKARLAAELVALQGAAPEPVHYVVFRSTQRADNSQVEAYSVVDDPDLLDRARFAAWVGDDASDADRLAIAVLVIREVLDSQGLILQGSIERRRGSADGLFCDSPARAEFAGPARSLRLYDVQADGSLVEIGPSLDADVPQVRPPETLGREQAVLRTRFGEGVAFLDARDPTLFEAALGLSAIVRVRTQDGRETGCGIGWHGSLPFVLEAEFPRFGAAAELSPQDRANIDAVLNGGNLVGGSVRHDEQGLAVIARAMSSGELFLLRPSAGEVQVQPYIPGGTAAAPDQQRWMHYAETHEGLTVLDSWRDGASENPIVLTGDADALIWRHHIDTDGVETWRKADGDAVFDAVLSQRQAASRQS